MAVQPLLNKKN